MYKSFEEKKSIIDLEKRIDKHGVRKPSVNSSIVGDEIKRPVHLKNKKKSLLKEKLDLLKRKRTKRKGL